MIAGSENKHEWDDIKVAKLLAIVIMCTNIQIVSSGQQDTEVVHAYFVI